MPRKKEDIRDYVSASDAAAILSEKYGRVIRPDYISKMSHTHKHTIRVAHFRRVQMYHRDDIEGCNLGHKQAG